MSDRKFHNGSGRVIMAAKIFGFWLLFGTLLTVAIKMLLASTIFGVSLTKLKPDNLPQSLGEVFLIVAIRLKNYAIETQILWLPVTIITSVYTLLSGLPTLRWTFLIIIVVIFVFLAAVISYAMHYRVMVDFDLLMLIYPFAAGLFCWWLTKNVAFSRS